MKRDLARLLADAERRGWLIERTRGSHFKLLHPPTGTVIYAGTTPSCARALRNLQADIARAERATETPR